jgi:hypothetical protein
MKSSRVLLNKRFALKIILKRYLLIWPRDCFRSNGWPSNLWPARYGPVDRMFGLTVSYCGRCFHLDKCLIKVSLLSLRIKSKSIIKIAALPYFFFIQDTRMNSCSSKLWKTATEWRHRNILQTSWRKWCKIVGRRILISDRLSAKLRKHSTGHSSPWSLLFTCNLTKIASD